MILLSYVRLRAIQPGGGVLGGAGLRRGLTGVEPCCVGAQPSVVEQWAAALCTPSMQQAHMECPGPHTNGDRVPAPRHRGVHQGLVRPRQGARHAAEGTIGPEQHNGRGCCRNYACTRERREREYRGSSWASSNGLVGGLRVSLFPVFHCKQHPYTQRVRYTHSSPVHLYPWVDIPAFAFYSQRLRHTTPHHTTPHHTTPQP